MCIRDSSYPHCWRCDTPLIYYARDSWFIKMTAVKDDLIRNNDTINWIPESIGKEMCIRDRVGSGQGGDLLFKRRQLLGRRVGRGRFHSRGCPRVCAGLGGRALLCKSRQ